MSKPSKPIQRQTADDLAASIEASLEQDAAPDSGKVNQVIDASPMQTSGNVFHIRNKGKRIPNEIWAKIEVGYRAGARASELALTHAVGAESIRVRARKLGWSRDLQARIREETAIKLASDGLSFGSSTEDIVDAASDAGAAVTMRHRRTTGRLGTIIELYATKLEQVLTSPAADVKAVAMEVLGARETIADAILKTANAISRLLPQERQANGLTGATDPATPYEEQVAAFMRAAEEARDGRRSA